jgi:tRNA (adenine22-N1)-methyltransferase
LNNYILSDRLQAIADLVLPDKSMADIGTDHGFVPIVLLEKGRVPFAVLSDINEGPVEKAKSHLAEHDIPERCYDLRLGDGLKTVDPFEVSTVIIAGMGGENIIDILAFDIAKTNSFERLILQPRKRPDLLRKWLWENGFALVYEKLVKEQEKICEIIVAEPAESPVQVPCDINEFYLPHLMREDALFDEFLSEYIRKLHVVLDNMDNSESAAEIRRPWEERLRYAETLKEKGKTIC